MFENLRKCLIQHCERSELRLQFKWTKVNQKCQIGQFDDFLKPEACSQKVLPDKNWWKCQIQKFKCDILGNFQTL